jgi:GT2 family glycosyltransferase/predicted  nucleic acid-binding Zn-ribbon protein
MPVAESSGAGTPEVAVIVVAYNQAAFIEEALLGVLNQVTSFDVAVLVHDDASTDGTLEIVREVAARYQGRITLIAEDLNQMSQGVCISARLLLDVKAPFVAFCDGDDVWTDPSKLERQVTFMREREWCSISHHAVSVINEADDIQYQRILEEVFNGPSRASERVDGTLLGEANFIMGCSAMVRRHALRDEALLACQNIVAEDWVFFALAAEFGDVGYLPEELAAYRLHADSCWFGATDQDRDVWTQETRWFLSAITIEPMRTSFREHLVASLIRADSPRQLVSIVGIRDRIEGLREELAAARAEAAELGERVGVREEELAAARAEAAELGERVGVREEELAAARAEVAELGERVGVREEELAVIHAEVAVLTHRMRDRARELAAARAEVAELGERVGVREEELAVVRAEAAVLTNRMRDRALELASSRVEVAGLVEAVGARDKELAVAHAEVDELVERLATADAEEAALVERVGACESELVSVREHDNQILSQLSLAERDLAGVRTEFAALVAGFDVANAELTRVQEEAGRLKAQVEWLEDEARLLDDDRSANRHALESIEASASWRLTSPFRRVRTALSGSTPKTERADSTTAVARGAESAGGGTGAASGVHRADLGSTVDDAGPQALVAVHIDWCWLLSDGSVCIDGWFMGLDQPGQRLEARMRNSVSDAVSEWSVLLRKARPDVAVGVLGVTGGPDAYGFVGRVPGVARKGKPVIVEFRGAAGIGDFRVTDTLADPVPEDAFRGAVVAWDSLSRAQLEPIAGTIRYSPAGLRPVATVAYRYTAAAEPPEVNFVVPVYADYRYLRNLLLSMSSWEASRVEVTAVCDDPPLADELVAWIREWNDNVYRVELTVLVHDINAGFAAACNSGWRASTSPMQLLLNSDVMIGQRQADLARLVSQLVDGVAAVAPVLLYPDGRLQHAGMVMEPSEDFLGFTLPMHPGKGDMPEDLPTEPFDVPMISGAAILTTSALLREVGGVPSVYGRGDFEDVLLSVEMLRHGRLVVDPYVRWVHLEGSSYLRHEHGGVPVTLAKSLVINDRLGIAG